MPPKLALENARLLTMDYHPGSIDNGSKFPATPTHEDYFQAALVRPFGTGIHTALSPLAARFDFCGVLTFLTHRVTIIYYLLYDAKGRK